MIRCSKCNNIPNLNDVIVWKCNFCGKSFQVTKDKLHSLLMKKEQNSNESILKCKSCGEFLDDGNETIAWKCSCGNVTTGKLRDFDENEKIEETEENTLKNNLIQCPKCGKKLINDEKISKRCLSCGVSWANIPPENISAIKMVPKENIISLWVKAVGYFIMLFGTLASLVASMTFSYQQGFSLDIFIVSESATIISGMLFLGLGEIISLLQDIKNKLK